MIFFQLIMGTIFLLLMIIGTVGKHFLNDDGMVDLFFLLPTLVVFLMGTGIFALVANFVNKFSSGL